MIINTLKNITTSSIGIISTLLIAYPLKAAERIHFIYGPLNLSLGVDSLETFAREGIINNELGFYFNIGNVSETQATQIQEALLKKAEIDPIQLSRFFNTTTGETLLERLGILISIRGGSNGKYALRGAMIQAALDKEEGLTLLNFINKYPVDIQLNVEQILEAAELFQLLNEITDALVTETEILSKPPSETAQQSNFGQLPDLRARGNYGIAPLQRWEIKDPNRERELYVLVYQPERWRQGSTPVVIISHGLGSKPEDFDFIAEHLTSYGYVVALPQHPGSDYQQLQDMLQGYAQEMYQVNDFIDRPLDISYLLDELERRNQTEFEGRLNLTNVGVIGHSFGGYTALALGGAKLDFDDLQRVCDKEVWSPNLSLLLQCEALDLPRQDYNFRDERVSAILAINPLNRRIFGEKGLREVTIPVLIGAGSQDPATPVFIEQVPAFIYLNSTNKYLALVVGQAHVNFDKLDASSEVLFQSLPDFRKPDQTLINSYGQAASLAFFEVYVANNQDYLTYLDVNYFEYISQSPNPIYFLDKSALISLFELYNNLRPDYIDPDVWPIMELNPE